MKLSPGMVALETPIKITEYSELVSSPAEPKPWMSSIYGDLRTGNGAILRVNLRISQCFQAGDESAVHIFGPQRFAFDRADRLKWAGIDASTAMGFALETAEMPWDEAQALAVERFGAH